MAEYYTVLTNKGAEKVASYLAGGPRIELTLIAVGDGGGSSFYTSYSRPQLRARTSLVNQRWADALYLVEKDADNPAWVITEGRVPAETGGWYIREVGIFDKAGDLIAIGVYPETYKPVLSNGIGTDLTIRSIIEVGDATSVTITIDPSVVQATREWVHQHKVDKSQLGNKADQLFTPRVLDEQGIEGSSIAGNYYIKNLAVVGNGRYILLFEFEDDTPVRRVSGTFYGNPYSDKFGQYTPNYGLKFNVNVFKPANSKTVKGNLTCHSVDGTVDYQLREVDYAGKRYLAIDRKDSSNTNRLLFKGTFVGFITADEDTFLEININSTKLTPLDFINFAGYERVRSAVPIDYHPGSITVGGSQIWHSGNTLIDSNGFIKQA